MIPLSAADRIIAIGSDGMMAAVAEARPAGLKRYFRPDHRAIASINSPMQCMMKEICAQCLQRHRDPVTGTVVFSCFNQDQEMDRVDFRTLRRRLSQNGVQEKLTKLWVDRCLQHLGERPAIAAEQGVKSFDEHQVCTRLGPRADRHRPCHDEALAGPPERIAWLRASGESARSDW
jgi:hypothetical protein